MGQSAKVLHSIEFLKKILCKKKSRWPPKKSKMAASKISFYRFAPQDWIYVINSKNIIVLSHFDEHFEKKNFQNPILFEWVMALANRSVFGQEYVICK